MKWYEKLTPEQVDLGLRNPHETNSRLLQPQRRKLFLRRSE